MKTECFLDHQLEWWTYQMQRSVGVGSDRVDVGLGVEEEQEDVLVPSDRRVVERRHAGVVARLRVGEDCAGAA